MTTNAIAFANMAAVAVQPSTLIATPLVRSAIMLRLFDTSMTSTIDGGARKPLMTAVQNSASIGLIPTKLMNMPTNVATIITA